MGRSDRLMRAEVNGVGGRREVRACLTHLHDRPFLQAHALSQQLPTVDGATRATDSPLRELLVEAVESLRPAFECSGASRAWRRYRAVVLRYLDGADVPTVCGGLGISQSEFYRLIREGLDEITSAVSSRLGAGGSSGPDGSVDGATLSLTRVARLGANAELVGRTHELHLLVAEFERIEARDGGRTVVVRGPTGVGKTRLAEELGSIVKERGGLVLTGRYFKDGYVPYDAWLEAIGPALGRLPEETISRFREAHPELVQLFPEWRSSAGGPIGPRILDDRERRRRMFDGVARLLNSLSEHQPVLLLLDDLHWAPGLPLFSHVARRIGSHRVLVLATVRDEGVDRETTISSELSELVRSRLVTELNVGRLSCGDTAALVTGLCQGPVSERLQEIVFRRTLGNPLFVEELIQSMCAAEAIRITEAGWDCATSDDPPVPLSLSSLIEARVRHLSPATQEMLAVAAVLGERFSGSVLQVMSEVIEPELVTAMEEALDAGLIVDESSDAQETYRFADPLVRDVVYEGLPGPTRRTMHSRACESIKKLYPDELERFTEELARHYAKASKPRAGADYAFRAGARAEGLFAWERAIAWYEMALALWDEAGGPPRRQAEACLRLGKVYQQSSSNSNRGTALLQRALDLDQQLGDWPEAATAHAELGRAYMLAADVSQIDTVRAANHLDTARSILEKMPVSAEVAHVYLSLALAEARLAQLPASIKWAKRARDVGLGLRRPEVVAESLATLGGHITATGDAAQGLALLEDGWHLATSEGLAVEADFCRHAGTWLTGVSLKNPRLGLAWAERQPDYHTVWSTMAVRSHLVAIRTLLGDFQAAAELYDELHRRQLGMGQPVYGQFPNNPGLYLLRAGAWTEAEAVLRAGLDWATAHHHYLSALPTATLLAEVLIAQGDLDLAEEHLVRALDRARAGDSNLNLLRIAVRLVDISIARGEVAKARELLDEVSRVAHGLRPHGGAAAEYVLASALVAAADGKWSDAGRAFDSAIAINQEFSLPWDEAYVHYRWSLALSSARSAPDGQDPAWHLQQATRRWQSMGAEQYAARSEQRYRSIHQTGRGRSPSRSKGSPRGPQAVNSTTTEVEPGREAATLAEARKGRDLG